MNYWLWTISLLGFINTSYQHERIVINGRLFPSIRDRDVLDIYTGDTGPRSPKFLSTGGHLAISAPPPTTAFFQWASHAGLMLRFACLQAAYSHKKGQVTWLVAAHWVVISWLIVLLLFLSSSEWLKIGSLNTKWLTASQISQWTASYYYLVSICDLMV